MVKDYGKLYDEFLYDCYIANQRLTDEDWLYYGREEHHIEIPNRDEGALTQLNSQHLTIYQHWVAGVLQSEVVGKLCFAFVPKNVLPPALELLRKKWAGSDTEQKRRAARIGRELLTPEQRSENARKDWEDRTPEQRSEQARRANSKLTPEQRSERQRRAMQTYLQNSTPEERSARIKKGHETRRRRQQGS